jgi:hypothetical protein
VSNSRKLGVQLAAVMAVATLCGTSAFAESRHRDETRGGEARATREDGRIERREQAPAAQQAQPQAQPQAQADNAARWQRSNRSGDNRSNDSRTYDARRSQPSGEAYNRGSRNDSYNRGNRNDTQNQNRSGRNDSYNRGNRNDSSNRGGSYDRNRTYSRNDSYRGGSRGTPYYTRGRVSRLERYNGGYRVWVGGARFPFFVPEARFRLFPFRVGIDINIGGYYNPLGYYDYYDGPAGVYTSGYLRGVVESVDYRRGTFVLRDDVSGSFVTSVMSGSERRWDNLRPGDYVEVSGEWSRSGVFEAYRLDALDEYRR